MKKSDPHSTDYQSRKQAFLPPFANLAEDGRTFREISHRSPKGFRCPLRRGLLAPFRLPLNVLRDRWPDVDWGSLLKRGLARGEKLSRLTVSRVS